MTRTHKPHLPTDRYEARANTRRKLRTRAEREGKSAKQIRGNARARLRDEYR
jgi:hypothetical protein